MTSPVITMARNNRTTKMVQALTPTPDVAHLNSPGKDGPEVGHCLGELLGVVSLVHFASFRRTALEQLEWQTEEVRDLYLCLRLEYTQTAVVK